MPQGQRLAPLIIPGGWCWVNLLLLPAMIHALRYPCTLPSSYQYLLVILTDLFWVTLALYRHPITCAIMLH